MQCIYLTIIYNVIVIFDFFFLMAAALYCFFIFYKVGDFLLSPLLSGKYLLLLIKRKTRY